MPERHRPPTHWQRRSSRRTCTSPAWDCRSLTRGWRVSDQCVRALVGAARRCTPAGHRSGRGNDHGHGEGGRLETEHRHHRGPSHGKSMGVCCRMVLLLGISGSPGARSVFSPPRRPNRMPVPRPLSRRIPPATGSSGAHGLHRRGMVILKGGRWFECF